MEKWSVRQRSADLRDLCHQVTTMLRIVFVAVERAYAKQLQKFFSFFSIPGKSLPGSPAQGQVPSGLRKP
jgi:hypothetical protein